MRIRNFNLQSSFLLVQPLYRVPTRSGNREKVGNFVIGREVGKMSGKTKHLKKCCVGKKVLFLYRDLDLGLDLFAS